MTSPGSPWTDVSGAARTLPSRYTCGMSAMYAANRSPTKTSATGQPRGSAPNAAWLRRSAAESMPTMMWPGPRSRHRVVDVGNEPTGAWGTSLLDRPVFVRPRDDSAGAAMTAADDGSEARHLV